MLFLVPSLVLQADHTHGVACQGAEPHIGFLVNLTCHFERG